MNRRENLGTCTAGGCHNQAIYLWSRMCQRCHREAHADRARRRDPDTEFLGNIGKGNYVDTGCEVSPLCLRCPLPMCRYEMTADELDMVQARMAI